ncbi:MAG TPA: leucine--tRNA ligase [Candidatus Aminicenantes bacterium]|nr:leucine--tRNA ligase [Candidatus Aminicenantes bacterium]
MIQTDFLPARYEEKWQRIWTEKNLHRCDTSKSEHKYFCMDMFPYASGSGLHVGHPRGYVLSDVWSRYMSIRGYNVLHPMGWDAFGLPAENDAIKKKINPRVSVKSNIKKFKQQLQRFGCMYDWEREINTSDPGYYRWTQWIFVKMFKAGLAYRQMVPINWCDSCKTGLANEEVINGGCERCGSPVVQRDLMQWMLRITRYADRLLKDLDDLDWPERVKILQRNWIGRSDGTEVVFRIHEAESKDAHDVRVFTTRADTLFGATYMVLAPEHPLVMRIASEAQKTGIREYLEQARRKSELQRSALDKEKTGVFTGAYALNPVNGREIPVWISDYVLMSYGTGAIMAVPAHDQRDFEFATRFNLPIREVISSPDTVKNQDDSLAVAYEGEGVMVNSGRFDGVSSHKGRRLITDELTSRGLGESRVNYKLRDWVFSRQRYWGEPIPIIICPQCGEVPVPEKDLPVLLPDVEHYEPTGTGESPLAGIDDWVNVACPHCGGPAKRETNTMPQWAGSCWYHLRYISPHYNKALVDPDLEARWMPVDQYVGGIEHAILHLLYARFYQKFLFDIGEVQWEEPYKRLFCIGMVTRRSEKTGRIEKMSKSKGNVVSPDEIMAEFGTDTLRMYELFIGPPEQDSEWSDRGIIGVYRFLKRTWELVTGWIASDQRRETESDAVARLRHRMIHDVTDRLESFKFNTAVSAFMEFTNALSLQLRGVASETVRDLLVLLTPFAPHFACELWEQAGFPGLVLDASWPQHDPRFLLDQEVEIGVQVKGKFRGSIRVPNNADQDTVMTYALRDATIHRHVGEGPFRKVIFIPGRILNIIP